MKRLPWLIAALAAGGIGWGWWNGSSLPAQKSSTALPAVASAPLAAFAAPAPRPTSSALATTSSSPAQCPHQQLEIALPEGAQRACVASTRTTQSGSVRGYMLEPEGLSRWSLHLFTAQGRVVRALLSAPPERAGESRQAYGCRGASCQGVALGKPDSTGARSLTLRNLRLQSLAPRDQPINAAAAPGASAAIGRATVVLSADLRTLADRQIAALACQLPNVTGTEQDGSLIDFCPMGGAGFEMGEEGRRSYQFYDLEGRKLAVGLAADGTIETVTFGALACTAVDCGSIATSVLGDASQPGSERSFTFSGTTLRDHNQTASAMLNGNLVMPSQEQP